MLREAEVNEIKLQIIRFNTEIQELSNTHGLALVDAHAFLTTVADQGIMIGGQPLTTSFTGGIFSLDGIHPNSVGYGILANEFLKEIARKQSKTQGEFGGFNQTIRLLTDNEILNP